MSFCQLIFRSYGPFVILGEEPIPLDISTAELLKERNTVDECVAFMAKEFDDAANELPDRYDGSNLGRIDRAACKAFKAKMLLYAASPLFNCNPDYAAIVNPESGKQLFPQDKSQEKAKWEAARDAYKEFFDEYGNTFSLYTEKTADGKIDFYESYRKVTSGVLYGTENKEQIFIRLADHDYRAYETTPYHKGYDDNNGALRGGLGFGVPQEHTKSCVFVNGSQSGEVIRVGEAWRTYINNGCIEEKMPMTAFCRLNTDKTTREEYFSGYIKYMRIWKGIRSRDDLRLSAMGQVDVDPNDPNLVAAWDFEVLGAQPSGTTITDITGRHVATLKGPEGTYQWVESTTIAQ